MTQSQERCALTVLTEPQPFIYRDEAVAAALSRTYPELVDRSDGRYDLLSVPSLKYLPKNRALQDVVVSDILTAIDLRKTDYLLVVTADHTHTPIVQRLKDHPVLRKKLKTIRGYTAKARFAAIPLRTLAVPCMGWYRQRGFLEQFAATFGGGDALGVMTLPAKGAKAVLGELAPFVKKGLNRIILCSGADDQERLSSASEFIRSSLGGDQVKIDRGIVHLQGNRVSRIVAVPTPNPQ